MDTITTNRVVWLNTFLLATTMIAALAPAARAQQAVELDQITVEGQAAKEDLKEGQTKTDPARTEATKSYTADKATIGGKGAVPLRQIPQSVSVVTKERIKDQNMTQLEDAARRSPGLLVLRNDPGRSSIFVRGFEFDNLQVDGMPAPMSSIYGTQPDLAIADRIEFLRGPAALYAGTGEPGGSVNLARKRATFDPQYAASASIGSWNNFRAEVDASGPLNEAKTVRGRIAGAFQDRESFVDVNENQVWVGYGTLDFDITDATTLSVAAWHQERDAVPFNGLPTYANGTLLNVPRSTFIGADWNTFENSSTEVLSELEHRLENGGHIKAAVRYVNRDADMLYGYSRTAAGTTGNVGTTGLARKFWQEGYSTDVHVSTPFEAWGLEHNFLIGFDHRDFSTILQNGTFSQAFPTVNVFNPTYDWADPIVAWGAKSDTQMEQSGVYSQLRLKPIEPLTLVFGGRVGWFDGYVQNLTTSAISSPYDFNAKAVPYAAAIFDLTDNLSVYASYAESFQPQSQTDVNGNLLGPREGEQYEVGIKGSWFGGNLTGSLALFQLQDRNRAVTVAGQTYSAAADVEIKGIEAEIGGRVAEGWDVYGAYSFADTEYLKEPNGVSGAFSTYWPKHTFSLWTKYAFQNPRLEGWHIGGGLKVVSSFSQVGTTYAIEEDGYVTVDGQIGYQFTKNVSAALTVTNIFDEEYYERVGGTGVFNFYGEPRAFNLTVRATF